MVGCEEMVGAGSRVAGHLCHLAKISVGLSFVWIARLKSDAQTAKQHATRRHHFLGA